jgi:DNA mismatch repair protein MutL
LGKFSITPSLDFTKDPTLDFRMPSKDTPIRPPTLKLNPKYNPFESQPKEISQRQNHNQENWDKLYPEKDSFGDEPVHHTAQATQAIQMEADLGNVDSAGENFFQLHGRYILSQVKSGLMVIDQQAAHERILFERYVDLLGKNKALSQQELFPVKISLAPAEAELLHELTDELNLLGFDLQPDPKKQFQFMVNGTPAGLKQGNVAELIEGIVENYKTNMLELNLDKKYNLARALAKNMSIKQGRKLQQLEMKGILESLFSCQVPDVSIDGEPVIRIIPLDAMMNFGADNTEQNPNK